MKHILQLGKYISVALLSAGTDWLVFSTLISLADAPYIPSLVAARICGGIVSFLSNRHWTWRQNRQIVLTQQGRRFLLLCGASYMLSVGQFYLLNTTFGIGAYPAKLATDCICFVVNYLVMHSYVFHKRRNPLKSLHWFVNRSDNA